MKSVKTHESAGNMAPRRGTTGKPPVLSGTTRFVHTGMLERSVWAAHKSRVNESKSRQNRSGSSGSSGSICGSGTTQLRVWFQLPPFMGYWYHSTYSQKRSGTTRRKPRKSSPRLAGSGCGTTTVFNGNSGELAPYGSTPISSVVPVNIGTVLLEPHVEHQLKGGRNNLHEHSHTNTHEYSRLSSVAGSCYAHHTPATGRLAATKPYTDNLRNRRRNPTCLSNQDQLNQR